MILKGLKYTEVVISNVIPLITSETIVKFCQIMYNHTRKPTRFLEMYVKSEL